MGDLPPKLNKKEEFSLLPCVVVQPNSWQVSPRQPLAHPSPSSATGWEREMDKRVNSRAEIKTV